jgi:hypothetical protein
MRTGVRSFLASAAAAAVLAASATALAQHAPPSQEEMKKRYEEKVGEAWFKDGGWTDDFDAARAAAKSSGKPILAYFTRSYAG